MPALVGCNFIAGLQPIILPSSTRGILYCFLGSAPTPSDPRSDPPSDPPSAPLQNRKRLQVWGLLQLQDLSSTKLDLGSCRASLIRTGDYPAGSSSVCFGETLMNVAPDPSQALQRPYSAPTDSQAHFPNTNLQNIYSTTRPQTDQPRGENPQKNIQPPQVAILDERPTCQHAPQQDILEGSQQPLQHHTKTKVADHMAADDAAAHQAAQLADYPSPAGCSNHISESLEPQVNISSPSHPIQPMSS